MSELVVIRHRRTSTDIEEGQQELENPVAAKRLATVPSSAVAPSEDVKAGEDQQGAGAPAEETRTPAEAEQSQRGALGHYSSSAAASGSLRILKSYGSHSATLTESVLEERKKNQQGSIQVRAVAMHDAKKIDAKARHRDIFNIAVTVVAMFLVLLIMCFHSPLVLSAVQKSVTAWKQLQHFAVEEFFGLRIGEVVFIQLLGSIALVISVGFLVRLCGYKRAVHISRTIELHWDNIDSEIRMKSKASPGPNSPGGASGLPPLDEHELQLKKISPYPEWMGDTLGPMSVAVHRFYNKFSFTGEYFFEKEGLLAVFSIVLQTLRLEEHGESGVQIEALYVFAVFIFLRSLLPIMLLRTSSEHVLLIHVYVVLKFILNVFFSYFALVYMLSLLIKESQVKPDPENINRQRRVFTANTITAVQNALMSGNGDAWKALVAIASGFLPLLFTFSDLVDLDQVNILSTVAALERIELKFYLTSSKWRSVGVVLIMVAGTTSLVLSLIGITGAACTSEDWKRICPYPAHVISVGLSQSINRFDDRFRSCPCSIAELVKSPANSTLTLPVIFDKHSQYLQGFYAQQSTIPAIPCVPASLKVLAVNDIGLENMACDYDAGQQYGKALMYLEIGSSPKLADITAIEGFTTLKVMELGNTNVSDIRPISKLTSLVSLFIYSSKIQDISPLEKTTKLRQLGLAQNFITDITPLSKLTDLSRVMLKRNKIADLASLSHLKQLKTLHVGPYVTDLTPLQDLAELSEIDLSFNLELRDISPLKSLPISFLNLQFTDVEDISPICTDKMAESLVFMFLANASITSVPSELSKMTSLMVLDLGNNELEAIPGGEAMASNFKSLRAGIGMDGNDKFCPPTGGSTGAADPASSGLSKCKGNYRAGFVLDMAGSPAIEACRNCTKRCARPCGSGMEGNGIHDTSCDACGGGDGGDRLASGTYVYHILPEYGPTFLS